MVSVETAREADPASVSASTTPTGAAGPPRAHRASSPGLARPPLADNHEPSKVNHHPGMVQGTACSLLAQLEENLAQMKQGPLLSGDRPPAISGGEEEEEDREYQEVLQDSEPGPLEDEGKDVEDVLVIISHSIYREAEGQALLKLCDKSSLLSVVSHALSAYITTLDPAPLQRLCARIAAEVSIWLCDLFHFTDGGAAYCHDDTRDGLTKVALMAMHRAYPTLAQDGFEALNEKPPVIYLTSNTYLEIAQHLCLSLGLPMSTVKVIMASPAVDKMAGLDVMEAAFKEDQDRGKTPILCIANVHSSLFQSMSAVDFVDVCRRHGIWLHLEGHALAGLALLGVDPHPDDDDPLFRAAGGGAPPKKPPPCGDSLSLTIGSWLGVPSLPFVTLYKVVGYESIAQTAGLSTLTPSVRLNCLPLWCVLKSLGARTFRDRICRIFEIMEILNNKLSENKCLRILVQRPAESGSRGTDDDDPFVTVDDLTKGKIDLGHLYRTVPPALAFQYISPDPPVAIDANKKGPLHGERMPTYFNNLNSWLGHTMQRDCPQIPLEIVDVETTGYVLRLCPFENLAFSGATLTEEDLEAFIEGIENQAAILNATVCQREKFIRLIDDEPRLEYIEIPHWAGLGGVSYLPPEFRPTLESELEDKAAGPPEGTTTELLASSSAEQPTTLEPVTDQNNKGHMDNANNNKVSPTREPRKIILSRSSQFTKDEVAVINSRNVDLLKTLRTHDSAFSLGECNGRLCIRFGMVRMDTEVEELLGLVVSTGSALDEQVMKLNEMGELVRKSIQQASKDLEKESDDALWQEGVLRHVPIVGSIYNWLSPLQKLQVKGRYLNLQEGKLETTDTVYRPTQHPPLQEHSSSSKKESPPPTLPSAQGDPTPPNRREAPGGAATVVQVEEQVADDGVPEEQQQILPAGLNGDLDLKKPEVAKELLVTDFKTAKDVKEGLLSRADGSAEPKQL